MFRTKNKKVSIALILIAIVYLILSFQLPSYAYVPVDSDLVPIGLGVILLLLSAMLFFTKDQEQKENEEHIPKKDLPIVLGVICFTILYIALLEIIGFIMTTMLFLFLCSLFLGYRKHVVNAAVSIVIPILIYLLFNDFLQVSLPTGILPF
ncbi:tripartite tricarboxylate transporter TctB family protein [Virgibacillus sp. 179-BFC.A HS]|uniref:Tripartite tricarboxylate transporter TctB family protein n=1 Tax=Tigheibacillus jepli TaxID=3035914 RepID=A0ABU5CFL4_9BACI|nr:tripartite tricarboxylate transporter TctB family protein [Virgibacillus sp. 179-BFC.A HS]MDY0404363.1 tripartite tricarboxylate transporter TctB family protein [Virgibacillus sp. 179-BFC.A HS]